jgi:hypothetical protein
VQPPCKETWTSTITVYNMKFPEQNGGNFHNKMLMFNRKIEKNCGFVWVTTSEFVLSVYKSNSCKFKATFVVTEYGLLLESM